MPDLLPHLRRELHALEHTAERYRAEGSGDIAALAERIVVVEKAVGNGKDAA